MSYSKTIVCLANSRKHSGRCIAGREVLQNDQIGSWVRPVSARQTAEISEEEMRYQNGKMPDLLNVMEIPMIGPVTPFPCQTENHIINEQASWTYKKSLPWEELAKFADNPDSLWTTGNSTNKGLNDRIDVNTASSFKNSLILIKLDSLIIQKRTEGGIDWPAKPKARAEFSYKNTDYILSVTDPRVEKIVFDQPDKDYKVTDAYLCISIGEPFTDSYGNTACYKLVAAIISKKHYGSKS